MILWRLVEYWLTVPEMSTDDVTVTAVGGRVAGGGGGGEHWPHVDGQTCRTPTPYWASLQWVARSAHSMGVELRKYMC